MRLQTNSLNKERSDRALTLTTSPLPYPASDCYSAGKWLTSGKRIGPTASKLQLRVHSSHPSTVPNTSRKSIFQSWSSSCSVVTQGSGLSCFELPASPPRSASAAKAKKRLIIFYSIVTISMNSAAALKKPLFGSAICGPLASRTSHGINICSLPSFHS